MTSLRTVALVVVVAMFAARSARPQTGGDEDSYWQTFHDKDLRRWAQRSGLSKDTLKELLRAAGREDDSAYDIENVDAQGLKNRGQVLLSIYEFGTGHCMTVYALDTRTPHFRKLWEASGATSSSFCTVSILGAATASVGPEGTIVVKLPVPKEGLPLSKLNSELLVADYLWTGQTYRLHAEKKFSRYKWNGKDWVFRGK